MHYLEEDVSPDIKLIVPYELKEAGYKLQELWGKDRVLITNDTSLFFEFLKVGSANVWLADERFLNVYEDKLISHVKDLPLIFLRLPNVRASLSTLNKWRPTSFLDFPYVQEQVDVVERNIKEALQDNVELQLFEAVKNNISKDEKKKVVLDMDRAFDKEINIIRNDLYYQQVDSLINENQKIRLDMFYKSMELLCGDSYSVRKIDEDKILFFIVDAMAKGVAAALTSTTSTSMLNYLIDEIQKENKFNFKIFLQKYIDYIKKELLDDEIVAAFFVVYDKKANVLNYAAFGTPPFLLLRNEKVEKIIANNMPIFKYTEDFKISSQELSNYRKLLLYSDGLCESELDDGRLYRTLLPQDFKESVNIVDFTAKMRERIGGGNDDIAFFYIDVIDVIQGESKQINIKSTREEVEEALLEFPKFLDNHIDNPKLGVEISLTLTELLSNALEHGSFGLGKFDKHVLIENDLFDDFISRIELVKGNMLIELCMKIYEKNNKKIFEACVKDKGKGFDTRLLKNLVINTEDFNGRGFMIIKKLVDRFYFNEKGNEINIVKFLN